MKKYDYADTFWDVAVIGGGPAGMMAAGRAAECGASVILLEKNPDLCKKLLITGGSRCNVTNAEFDNKKLLAKFKAGGKFLSSPFSQWSVQETLDFFHAHAMPTKEEAGLRVFPASNTARSVWEALVEYLKKQRVAVICSTPVVQLHVKEHMITAAETKGGRMIRAQSFILATGGTSHPETGSTGDGFKWLRALDHSVSEARAAIVPVALQNPVVGAAGVSVSDANITLYQNGQKQARGSGKILFTHVGLSGPAILNMSHDIGELLEHGALVIEIDLLPERGYEKVNATLQDTFQEHRNKKIRNALRGILSSALVLHVLNAAGIDPDTPCNNITRDARVRLMKTLKHLRFEVKPLRPG